MFVSFVIFQRFDGGYTYSVFYFRYGIYFLSVYYFIFHFEKLDQHFLKVILFINIFLILDAIFQFIFDIIFLVLLFKTKVEFSVFGEELVLGSFICKISPFCFSLLFTTNTKVILKF